MNLLFIILMQITPPCATEDSGFCHWDASRLNGEGQSFVAITENWTLDAEGLWRHFK